ncbi:hypothetical protein AMAG_05573 [Allomyces macrogynus ATCC 38327]|uniref:Golgi SNAP receptor complex member 1 n=1 Tax=Allomyces macrogynus (strain ATCC 38327) TaxID=578462 RepID=A0A0L0SCD9_ALLM3|nr:hypothetical protein AMAG_05573 [Allomyces macrogynus ATCC 38327]|eukprot:KNE60151.1 hypothetical protein AMAG_05573 [Allomyces macrogynus ATCC 38327]
MATTTMSSPTLGSPNDWNSLRRSARQVEAECQSKLAKFSAMAAAYSSQAQGTAGAGSNSSSARLGSSGPAASASTEAIEREITDLLRQLANHVDRLSSNDVQAKAPPASFHLAQRHRDTLQDLTREFRRIKSNLVAAREHAELLESVRSDIKAAKTFDENYLATERMRLDSTHIMVDDLIEQAQETHSDLTAQRELLLGANRRMGGVNGVFPQLMSLMTRIRIRKRRDTIILSGVTAVCIFLLYLMHG